MLDMSRVIAGLLGAGEPMFSLALQRLEKASAQQSVDVRLTAEIIHKCSIATRALGLDQRDTSGPELYHALKNLAGLHDSFLARRLGAADVEDVADILNRIRIASQNVHVPRRAWLMKHSTMKRLLKTAQPKKTMKALGYRSIDSMLKREPLAIVHATMRVVESDAWQKALLGKYKKLTPLDFEMRDIDISMATNTHTTKIFSDYIRNKRHNIVHSKELGTVVILALPVKRLKGVTIAVFPRVLHYINEIRLYSAYFKLQQVKPNYGQLVADMIADDPDDQVRMAGQQLHWRVVQKRFGKQQQLLPEMFEPHVQLEDMEWRTAEDVLYSIEPALHFWHELEYVGRQFGNHRVSFNLIDMAANYINDLEYGKHTVEYMQRALWSELMVRYMQQPPLERRVLAQLDNRQQSVEPLLRLNLKGVS